MTELTGVETHQPARSPDLDALVAGLLVTASAVIMSVLALSWGWIASAVVAAVLLGASVRMNDGLATVPVRLLLAAGGLLDVAVAAVTLLG